MVGAFERQLCLTLVRPVPDSTTASTDRKHTHLLSTDIPTFLETSLASITRSQSSRHELIATWALETGLAKVRQIVEADFAFTYSVTKLMFDPHCVIFLNILSRISQEQRLFSLTLEKAVGTIYNVVYGLHGNRAVGFFRRVVAWLTRQWTEMPQGPSNYDQVLLHTTDVILSTIIQNHEAVVQPELRSLVKELANCSSLATSTLDSDGSISVDMRHVKENIRMMQDLLGTTEGAGATSKKAQPAVVLSERGAAPVDGPGQLSVDGPRHDNDHRTITGIRVLPTLSEIWLSRRPDFLPTRDSLHGPESHHDRGIRRLLDTHFRLLREDTAGVLRDTVRVILEHWDALAHETRSRERRKILRAHSPTPVRIYLNAHVQQVRSDGMKGIQIDVGFDQSPRARTLKVAQRREYWRRSGALREGPALLALIDGKVDEDIKLVFLQVSQRNLGLKATEGSNAAEGVCDLVSDSRRAMITLRLPGSPSREDLSNLVSLTGHRLIPSSSRSLVLVEFPAVLYNSFEGILRRLQELYTDPSSIPLTTWIAPRDDSYALPPDPTSTITAYKDRKVLVSLPTYLVNETLDLSSIPKAPEIGENLTHTELPITLYPGQDTGVLCEQLSKRTTLDPGQAEALVSALTNEVALIQGPPGTGKSYVGIQIARCLLTNRQVLGPGPILCVCYTNHALDQFLEGLLDSGISKILRLGGPSKSNRLDLLSIDSYKRSDKIPRIPGKGRVVQESKHHLDNLAWQIGEICEKIAQPGTRMVKEFLIRRSPNHAKQITQAVPIRDSDNVAIWLEGNAPGDLSGNGGERSLDQLLSIDLWTLKNDERCRLFSHWHEAARADLILHFHNLVRLHAREKQRHTALFHQEDAQLFGMVDVVGVTTASLANNIDLLRSLPARVLICEEAGEVLESHFLAALLPSLQHAILIGDHLQLRPKIANRRLSMEYNQIGPKYSLDQSLFERLANLAFHDHHASSGTVGGVSRGLRRFPVAQLSHQRRMHPSIASLVRETIYPKLQDHPWTSAYPEIAGMRRRLFWLDHRQPEDPDDPDDPMQSKTNAWEANLVIALVKHLCRQGRYRPGDIAILTPYIAQLRLLQDRLEDVAKLIIHADDLDNLDGPDSMEDTAHIDYTRGSSRRQIIGTGKLLDELRLATVDNFQGDEATVVIVSLVRSNKYQNCGFLKTPNRINVLLSRAKHGMYIIGDAKTASSAPMWKSVIAMLEEGQNIGPKIELQCSRHGDRQIFVSSPEDFLVQAPEGGCDQRCAWRLPCGHRCMVKCHSNTLHEAVQCLEPCPRMRECGHVCQRRCHQPCGECIQTVPNVTLPCGHTTDIACRQQKYLSLVQCTKMVTKKIPQCGHAARVLCSCHDITKMQCTEFCGAALDCGHTCRRRCSTCRSAVYQTHGACTVRCGRAFTTCSHTCSQPCHPSTPCPPCQQPCEVRCKHSQCPGKCSDPCPPCAEKCGWSCSHREGVCELPCAVPCNTIPCDLRCTKTLACGHQCPSVCGERCPDATLCQKCGAEAVRSRIVDLISMGTYHNINADEDPLVFLSCNHFYTVSSLDGAMGLKDYYDVDPDTGKVVRPKPSRRVANGESTILGCPECRTPLRNIDRYNRIVKKALLDESTRRFIVKANRDLGTLLDELGSWEVIVDKERAKLVGSWPESTTSSAAKKSTEVQAAVAEYQHTARHLESRIEKFIKSVAAVEQPYGKMNNLLATFLARQQSGGMPHPAMPMDESAVQTGFHLRGRCLQIRFAWAMLWDYRTISVNISVDSRIRDELREVIGRKFDEVTAKCLAIKEASQMANFLPQQVESMVFYVLFSSLAVRHAEESDCPLSEMASIEHIEEVSQVLRECESIVAAHPGTLAFLRNDIDKARKLFRGDTFYTAVTTEETRQVYQAMATQFSGTGHWYYCRNNHPFTIGECGMPTEAAQCPQCGEGVGGYDHQPLPGVRRAEDLEAAYGDD
ncbi:hypothetical protein ASPZODRAFT_2129422 [Penicilliopsis zonata CBS 506.65]|uniref:RZ-type domain-containing protein n=1 Tax=Penicilliopsis zonata CBS 506.65 TaxID=1073090 RepID=A0A1L9SGV2_9EURO|nr:hypothetical protein ASPZODRAFT_2129422 [Penicilliopsis zonata CBS 506.65]OJJ46412.1 hypothetical protein ASPZODRAFT_2129422 [Penicilliopsis zonata CBS 506.65]